MNPPTEISPSTQFLLDEIRKLFDKFDARWAKQDAEREASRGVPIPTHSTAIGAHVVADNWGGLFDGGDDSNEQLYDAPIVADNWGGLFEQPADVLEEHDFEPTDRICIESCFASADSDAFTVSAAVFPVEDSIAADLSVHLPGAQAEQWPTLVPAPILSPHLFPCASTAIAASRSNTNTTKLQRHMRGRMPSFRNDISGAVSEDAFTRLTRLVRLDLASLGNDDSRVRLSLINSCAVTAANSVVAIGATDTTGCNSTPSLTPSLLQAHTVNMKLTLGDTSTAVTPSDFSIAHRSLNHGAPANRSTKCPGGADEAVAPTAPSAIAVVPIIISTRAADMPTIIYVDTGGAVSASLLIASMPEVLPVCSKVSDRKLLTCEGEFLILCACNLIEVHEVLGRSYDVVVVQSRLFSSLDWFEQQPWPSPPDDLRLTICDAELRPTPWPSFNMTERLSVLSFCGRLWKPPWPIHIRQHISLIMLSSAWWNSRDQCEMLIQLKAWPARHGHQVGLSVALLCSSPQASLSCVLFSIFLVKARYFVETVMAMVWRIFTICDPVPDAAGFMVVEFQSIVGIRASPYCLSTHTGTWFASQNVPKQINSGSIASIVVATTCPAKKVFVRLLVEIQVHIASISDSDQLRLLLWLSFSCYAALVLWIKSLVVADDIIAKPPWLSFAPGTLFKVDCSCSNRRVSLQYALQLSFDGQHIQSPCYLSGVTCKSLWLLVFFQYISNCRWSSTAHTDELLMLDFTWEEDQILPLPPLKIQHPSVVPCSNVSLAWDPGGKMGEQYAPCIKKLNSTVYFNLAEVQKALHVNPVIRRSKWTTCSEAVTTHWGNCERSVLHVYPKLIQYGIYIWMFSGDPDAVSSVSSIRCSIDALKRPTIIP